MYEFVCRNLSGSECGTANTPAINDDNIKKRFENIKKSPNDSQFYRGLILNNDMKVLLISDPTTDKSAVSLDVNVGKFIIYIFNIIIYLYVYYV